MRTAHQLLDRAFHMRTCVVAVLALAAAVLRPAAARATTAADICDDAATTCELTRELTVTPGSTLDFGDRPFTIKAPDGRLQVGSGDTLMIAAGSMVIETGTGGRLRSAPGSDGGCRIDIRVGGTFSVVRVGATTITGIDLSSFTDPCTLELSAEGDVTIGGEIHARGVGLDSAGGEIFIGSGGRVTVADHILADSPVVGGAIELDAKGPIEVTNGGDIDASDAFGLGSIVLSTESDLVNAGRLDVRGRPSDFFGCDGGFVILSALGDIRIDGPISANGASLPEAGCLGGTLTMLARGSILVNAAIDLSGGPNGQGGILEEVQAGRDFVQTASILIGAGGPVGQGGDVDIVAGRRLHVGALLDLTGGRTVDLASGLKGGGGYLAVTAGETLEIAGEIAADGADFGSLAFSTTRDDGDIPGRIVVSGDIHALSSADEDIPADVRLEACEIEVTETGSLHKAGPASRNLLRASGAMRIAGTLDAGVGSNELQYRNPTRPPLILPTAVVNPSAIATATPDEPLRPCACTLDPQAAGFLCNDGNVCTQEVCDPILGCTSVPLAGEGIAGCDDGNACDGRETCNALACQPGPVPRADDGDPCTDDGACDPATGYAHTPKTGLGAATCRMDRIESTLAAANVPGDVSAKSLRKIRRLARTVRSTIEKAGATAGKRRAKLLKGAAKKLGRLDQVLTSPKTSITTQLAQALVATTTELRGALTQI